MSDERDETLLQLTADIVAAHVANNTVPLSELPEMISAVHSALSGLNKGGSAAPAEALIPRISVRASIKPDHLVCMEDGLKMKMLKRHLMSQHGMTPEQYRAKWGLPADYPMAAPNYREQRRDLALSIGLGKRPVVEAKKAAPKKAPAKRGPKKAPAEG